MKLESSVQVFEKTRISNFKKIQPLGVELFHADRRTDGRTDGETKRLPDMTKANSRFSQLCEGA
jgi:hypothetical protein